MDAQAAATGPLEAMLQSARCGEAIAVAGADRKVDAAPGQTSRDRAPERSPGSSHACPLCATACLLGGCAPVDGGASPFAAVARMPRGFPGIGDFLHLVSVKPARLLSDAAAQAPPAPSGSHVHAISVQS